MKQNYYRDLLNKYKTNIRKIWRIMKTNQIVVILLI